jgi:hypothetical protein
MARDAEEGRDPGLALKNLTEKLFRDSRTKVQLESSQKQITDWANTKESTCLW